jgi:colanic acid/amylovoran biosynthesis glycosyltransferase
MRIAFFSFNFPVLSETFVLNQIASLIDRGHDVEIVAENAIDGGRSHDVVQNYRLLEKVTYSDIAPRGRISNNPWAVLRKIASNPNSSGAKLLKSLNWLRYGETARNLRLFRATSSLLPGRHYDAIISHFGPNGEIALRLREIGVLRGPLLTYFHGWDVSSYIRAQGPRAYARLFAKGDLFLPISERWKQKLLKLGCDERYIRVHHMGIDTSRFIFAPRRPRPGQPTRLISVARLVEKKGIEVALRAIASLLPNQRISYTVVGDGPLRKQLTELTAELGLNAEVRFTGALPQQEVVKLLTESDILLAPSITAEDGNEEGIPVAIMEAMAMGMPVVSTRHSGIPELVEDGVCGLLAPERDVRALADRLTLLLTKPAIWEQMGTAGRAKVEADFNLGTLSDELTDLLAELPARRPSRLEDRFAIRRAESDARNV